MDAQWPGAILSTVALACVLAAAYMLNDACDYAADRINAPHRPIVAGRVSRRAAIAGSIVLLGGAVSVAALQRWQFLLVFSLVIVALVCYDLFSKQLGSAKQPLVAMLMTTIYPLALAQSGGAAGSRALTLLAFPIWLFLTSLGYELLKDIRDIPGDLTVVRRVTWFQRHPGLGRRIATAAILAGAPVLVVPFFLGCQWVYLAIVTAAIAAAFISAFVPTRRAILLVYLECSIVGVAATADVMVCGP